MNPYRRIFEKLLKKSIGYFKKEFLLKEKINFPKGGKKKKKRGGGGKEMGKETGDLKFDGNLGQKTRLCTIFC